MLSIFGFGIVSLKHWKAAQRSGIFSSVCSPTAVHSAGAAAALHPLPQEAAGVPVCQCFLWWSLTFGAVFVWSGVLRRAWVDGALLGSSGKRLNWNQSSLHLILTGSTRRYWSFVLFFLGTGTLFSQLDWFHVAGNALFIGASLMQHQSMVLLARLRTGKSGKFVQPSLFKKQCFSANFRPFTENDVYLITVDYFLKYHNY